MSPFYRKEGNNWIPLELIPPDIHVGKRSDDKWSDDKACVFTNPQDIEQITVYTTGRVIAREEGGYIIFPGQRDKDGGGLLINRRDVIFENLATGDMEMIIHSEKPIGKGK